MRGRALWAMVLVVACSACACLLHGAKQIETRADAQKVNGERVRIVGVAERAKLAPMVIADSGFSVYCLDLDDWPPEVYGKRVQVEGVLEQTDQFKVYVDENGAISQGTAGGDWVMRKTTFRLVE